MPSVPGAVAVLRAYLPVKKGIFGLPLPAQHYAAEGRIEVAWCTSPSADPHHRVLPSPVPDMQGIEQEWFGKASGGKAAARHPDDVDGPLS